MEVLEGQLGGSGSLDCSPAVTPWGSYPVVRRWRPEVIPPRVRAHAPLGGASRRAGGPPAGGVLPGIRWAGTDKPRGCARPP
eukprot:13580634-Alexandrium_andersonii.AAC.1